MGVCSRVVVAVFIVLLGVGAQWVEGQVHHVVGGDRGWAPISDVESWSFTRDFRVGDNLWFTYSGPGESISELKTREEYESCDLNNPIRMYTDGVSKVNLDAEGSRYFVSSRSENCKTGLKLHVNVLPKDARPVATANNVALATGPTPSGSVSLKGVSTLLFFGLVLIGYMGF